MYLKFFGLNEKPFAITPDPRYLYLSERHGEGLAHLVYGVTESGGFIQLTGEVGTGKTTLVRTLLKQLPNEVDVALVLNPQLTALEFLHSICDELGVELSGNASGSKALVDALNRHLLATHAKGRRTILLVDEAQNLSADVLEQVRLLTNLETARQKLLQIILIGQPELREVLAQNDLRQLAQRVTGRYHLEPLSRDETIDYIDHRLRVAGALTELFEPAARRQVYRLSGGIPRLVNVICDRALLGAYSLETRRITPAIVRRAAAEVSGGESRRGGRLWPAAAGVAVALLIVAGGWWWQQATPPPAFADEAQAADDGNDPAAVASDDAPAAAEPQVAATMPLNDRLAGQPTSRDGAITTLFGLWQGDPQIVASCENAAAAGLACLSQRGSWPLLRQLDRPAMLTLIDTDGQRHFVVVERISGDRATLRLAGEQVEYPLADIGDLWFGDYLLVWRPPTGRLEALRPGSRGPGVRWLRDSLAALDGDAPADDGDPQVFDAALETRLRDFQRRNRLQVDGLAGQQTQIMINSLLDAENTPRLGDDGR